MKILTILGTRPEIIRLSLIIKRLDSICQHVIVHTEQNHDFELNKIFFDQLEVRKPDYFLGAKGNFGQQLGTIISGLEEILTKEKPDRFLVLGDTNSSLGAIIAKRMGIPVFHMEAGNRCYDEAVPEEVNRRIIDHSSDILMPYTERSRQNLLAEGISGRKIYVTGNPIYEVLKFFERKIEASGILKTLGIQKDGFFLCTLHRAENVDDPVRLSKFISTLQDASEEYKKPVILSCHPRLALRLKEHSIPLNSQLIRISKPFGFFEFVHLEKTAFCVLSDSGTVQEECSIFRRPNVTLRNSTERPETLECGSNFLSGAETEYVTRGIKLALELSQNNGSEFVPTPKEYLQDNVSSVVARLVTGYLKR